MGATAASWKTNSALIWAESRTDVQSVTSSSHRGPLVTSASTPRQHPPDHTSLQILLDCCCFSLLQIPVIFFRSTEKPWRASLCRSTSMSGLTWYLATNREAVKLWQLTMVKHLLLSNSCLLNMDKITPVSLSFSVSPSDVWRWRRLWQVWEKIHRAFIPIFFSSASHQIFMFHLSTKHREPRRADRHADADPGVRSDANTAVYQPSPPADHAAVPQHYSKPQHQLTCQWAVSRYRTEPLFWESWSYSIL